MIIRSILVLAAALALQMALNTAITPLYGGCVAALEPSHELYIKGSACPDDTELHKQWALFRIDAPEAWGITSGDPEIVIAILDTGIYGMHPDLKGKIVAESNFSTSPTLIDINGHGTHIAGIISAAGEDRCGIVGTAYRSRLMNVKVTDDAGHFKSEELARGIIWAVDHGASVVNLSLVDLQPLAEVEKAIDYAWEKGAVIVAAAGNYVDGKKVYPAYHSNCIAVAATGANDALAAWSNYGEWVDVAAPGVDIYSTLPFNEYGYKSGTSMATAFVSGIAGLLFSLAEDTNANGLTNDEVRTAIKAACVTHESPDAGPGCINVLEAINYLLYLQ